MQILDAARPRSVSRAMWEKMKGTKFERYVANPEKGSMHNYGCAVDLSIMKKNELLDMGTKYDYFGELAQPRYEMKFLTER